MMKNIKKWIISLSIIGCSFFVILNPQMAAAESDIIIEKYNPIYSMGAVICTNRFLGFPAWYNGLLDGSCNVTSPSSAGLSNFIWHIVMNVIEAAMMLVGYIAVGFILYGGFQYLTSQGTPDAAAKARTTITNAVIGLVISLVAVAIINFIVGGLAP